MHLLDTLFAGYRWYRRWCGGTWYYRYLDHPVGTFVWSRTPIQGPGARGDTRIEDYP